jgi:tetratricopeptide (TPR) repeat protein/S1-C subfamily serine protease
MIGWCNGRLAAAVGAAFLAVATAAAAASPPNADGKAPGSRDTQAGRLSVEAVQLDVAPTSTIPQDKTTLYRSLLRSAVFIVSEDGTGSGWLVDKERRLVVTNDHVVDKAKTVHAFFPEYEQGRLITDAKRYLREVTPIKAVVLDSDSKCDLALIQLERVPEASQAVALAKESPSPGESVHSIGGNPEGTPAVWIYTFGTVRQVHRYNCPPRDGKPAFDATVVSTQSPTNCGDSGSAIVNDRGELVGVVSRNSLRSTLMDFGIDVSEVRSYLKIALELVEPKTAQQYNLRGCRHSRQHRYALAIRDHTEALRLDPKFLLAAANRGWATMSAGDNATALADFNNAIQHGYAKANAYAGRAAVYLRTGRFKEALADLTEAVRQDPNNPVYYCDRGAAHARLGDDQEAIADYTRSLQQKPNARAYFSRGWAHVRLGHKPDAAKDFTEAIQLEPWQPAPYSGRAYVLARLDQLQPALDDYCRAIALAKTQPTYYNERGEFFLDHDRAKDALADFTQAIELNSKTGLYHLNRGRALQAMSKSELAEREFAEAFALSPQLKKAWTRFYAKQVIIANHTQRPRRVYVVYRDVDAKNVSKWVPEPPGGANNSVAWTFQPGERSYLAHAGARVQAQQVLMWIGPAESSRPDGRPTVYTLTASEGYVAKEIATAVIEVEP